MSIVCNYANKIVNEPTASDYNSLFIPSISNPTLLLALAFCFGSWWFIAIKNNSENIRLFGKGESNLKCWFIFGVYKCNRSGHQCKGTLSDSDCDMYPTVLYCWCRKCSVLDNWYV